MGENLRDGDFRHLAVQALDILPDLIVEPQFALLAQLHDSGRGETFGMRGDPKPVARGQLFARDEIGVAERMLGHDLAAVRDRDDAAGLLRRPHLKFDPAADVIDRALLPDSISAVLSLILNRQLTSAVCGIVSTTNSAGLIGAKPITMLTTPFSMSAGVVVVLSHFTK